LDLFLQEKIIIGGLYFFGGGARREDAGGGGREWCAKMVAQLRRWRIKVYKTFFDMN